MIAGDIQHYAKGTFKFDYGFQDFFPLANYAHFIKLSLYNHLPLDKLCIKMMGYPWKIDWNQEHHYFLFKIQRKQWKRHGCIFMLTLASVDHPFTRRPYFVALNNALKQQIEEELECSLHTWCCFLQIPD